MKVFRNDKKFKKQIRKLAIVKQLKHNELLNITEPNTKLSKLSFEKLEIHEFIQKALKAMHLSHATDIQTKILEHALKFRNVLASEKTGSGKTLAYLIPLLQLVLRFRFRAYNGTCAIVIVPSKELSVQVCSVFGQLSEYTNIRYGLINGEAHIKEEEKNLALGCTVLIATPTALRRHMKRSLKKKEEENIEYFRYHNLRYLVLDEADRLIKESCSKVLEDVIEALPKTRQTLVLSATLNLDLDDSLEKINTFSEKLFTRPFVRINVPMKSKGGVKGNVNQNATVDNLIEGYSIVPANKRILFLYNLIRRTKDKKVMIFFSSSEEVEFFFRFLSMLNINNQTLMMMHSNLSNELRTSTLIRYSKLTSCFLLCTDLVSRGIDIPQVNLVVQFDVPSDLSSYIHRVGRTARGGQEGTSIIILRPAESTGILEHLRKVSVALIEFEACLLSEITDFYERMTKKSPLIKLAESALVNQLTLYKESQLTDSLTHIDIKEEIVNYCLEKVPKNLPKKLKCVKKT